MNEKIIKSGRYRFKGEELKRKEIGLNSAVFDGFLFVAIISGLLFLISLTTDIFPVETFDILNILYIISISIIVIITTIYIFTDIRHHKKLSLNTVALITALIFLNLNFFIGGIQKEAFTQLDLTSLSVYMISIIVGLIILSLIFFENVLMGLFPRSKLKKLNKTGIALQTISTAGLFIVIISIIATSLVGIVAFTQQSGSIYIFKAQIERIGEIWDWGVFLIYMNIMITLPLVVVFLIEVKYDLFWDWDDTIASWIKDRVRWLR